MISALLIICGCLSVGLYLVIRKEAQCKKDLIYLKNKLSEVNGSQTEEYIKIVTNDEITQQLLIEMNALLANYYAKEGKYIELELSTKQMISNISHDLKTPLTVIQGYLEKELLKTPMENDSKKNLERVYSKTLELIALMNQFFELAKLESGDVEIRRERVEVTELCREIIVSYYSMIQEKAMDVDLKIPDGPVFILSNREMLMRILTNLITNALRYGDDGKVLGITLKNDGEEVAISIWDKGKGIAKEYQRSVFNRLFTLEDSRNKMYQGSGLGLSITKQLVEQLDGEIDLRSTPNELTVFTVRFKQFKF
ncbi:sensor histidine kinase [Wukongibacter baidiensis]|uniref:sensor histidine kinase n=1 Tax=Wukongibacter baidiensis TaxID=1723361 RepID=UPI003D7FCA7E